MFRVFSMTDLAISDSPVAASHFPALLIQIRRHTKTTQQALADAAKIHVSLDQLMFDEGERGPSEDLRLQFEAVNHMSDDDQRIIKALLDGMIVKHQTKRMIGDLS
jgi:hypothetical protein